MNLLKTLWVKYKIVFGIVALCLYTFCVWNITTKLNENTLLKDEVAKLQFNAGLGKDIQDRLEKSLKSYQSKAGPITKEIQREIITNNIYSDCKSTDGIVRSYRDKLDAQ